MFRVLFESFCDVSCCAWRGFISCVMVLIPESGPWSKSWESARASAPLSSMCLIRRILTTRMIRENIVQCQARSLCLGLPSGPGSLTSYESMTAISTKEAIHSLRILFIYLILLSSEEARGLESCMLKAVYWRQSGYIYLTEAAESRNFENKTSSVLSGDTESWSI